ncbi:MAG: hypothetical protein FWB86_09600 [Treponema sp.]|nr:hypothetical protein [Treponema sp.]MCL2252248.1 hypothetical protein [Treponema sp.]
MKKTTLIIISFFAILLLNTCALEIANVIGPDGGYVFYDKGNYSHGWRYIQCSPYDFGTVDLTDPEAGVKEALRLCKENNAEWHKFGWELPKEADIKKMLECFSYGLTRFKPDFHYLSVNDLYALGQHWICSGTSPAHSPIENTGKFCVECGKPASDLISDDSYPPNPDFLKNPSNWKPKVFHKNFKNEPNGAIEPVTTFSQPIRVRAIRRF